jgi:hypothetical protein
LPPFVRVRASEDGFSLVAFPFVKRIRTQSRRLFRIALDRRRLAAMIVLYASGDKPHVIREDFLTLKANDAAGHWNGLQLTENAGPIPLGPTLDDLPTGQAAARDPRQRFLIRRNGAAVRSVGGASPSRPPEHDDVFGGDQFVYFNPKTRKRKAVQCRADFYRLGTKDEIRDQAIVVDIIGSEQLVGRVKIALVPDRLDRPTHQRFVV